MTLKILASEAHQFFDSKNIDVYTCKLCGSGDIRSFANPLNRDENVELFVFPQESELDSDGSMATSYTIKLFCNNCGNENHFNAELIRKHLNSLIGGHSE